MRKSHPTIQLAQDSISETVFNIVAILSFSGCMLGKLLKKLI